MKVGKTNLWICLLAGIMDGATGALLLTAPAFTLSLMGLAGDLAPDAYLRFVGAFVFSVGTLYGFAWRLAKADRYIEWRILWLGTAWVRLCVGSTVLVLIATGQLELGWLSVPVADLGLGGYQLLTIGFPER